MTERLDTLLTGYRDEAHTAFAPPDLHSTRGAARRRRARRDLAMVGVAAAAAAMVWLAVSNVGTATRTPADPPAPVATSIYAVDWTNTELTVPDDPDWDCPKGRLRLYHRQTPRGGWIGTSDPWLDTGHKSMSTGGLASYGDLTGDGQPEAVLLVRCAYGAAGFSDYDGQRLLVVRMRPDRSLEGLGFVGTRSAEFPSFRVSDDGLLRVQLRYNWITENSTTFTSWDTAFIQVFRWNGSSFVRISGRTEPLNFTGASAGYGVPTQLADILAPTGEVLCPAALVPFGLVERSGQPWHVDGYDYSLGSAMAARLDVDSDGNEELVVPIRCSGPGYDAVSLYVLAQGTDRFRAIDVPIASDGSTAILSAEAMSGRLVVQVQGAASMSSGSASFTWTGSRFERDHGLPEEFGTPGSYRLVS